MNALMMERAYVKRQASEAISKYPPAKPGALGV